MQKTLSELDMLAERTLDGDATAYNMLLIRITPALQKYFVRQFRMSQANADDLAQETLLAIHTKFHTFKRGSPFAPWLYAVAKYRALDHLRSSRRRTTATEVPLDDNLIETDNAQEDRRDLLQLLQQLSARDKELLQLAKVEGLSMQQISERLNISLNAVKVGIHRAVKRLTHLASRQTS